MHVAAQWQHVALQALGGDRGGRQSGLLFSPPISFQLARGFGSGAEPIRVGPRTAGSNFPDGRWQRNARHRSFGLRLQRHSFEFFIEKLCVLFPGHSKDVARFQAAFGRTLFVHLTRRDKVAQAVSYVRARQTGLWHAAPDGTELERLSPPREPVYDASEIRACFEEMTAQDFNWGRWFVASEIDPLRITYEELSAAPTKALWTMLDRLGLERGAALASNPPSPNWRMTLIRTGRRASAFGSRSAQSRRHRPR